jgi:AcrR family transcriptional regulator
VRAQETTQGRTPARRPRRSWSSRRPEVLAAAREVFVASGYAGTTMRAIATAADINEAILYRYFTSKEQLFEHAIAAPLEEVALSIVTPAESALDIERLTVRFFRELLDAMRTLAPLLNVVLGDEELGQHFYQLHIEPALDRIKLATQDNFASWAPSNFDAGLATRVAYGTCWFLALDDRFGTGLGQTSDVLAHELARMLLNGLKDDPGSVPSGLQAD